MKNIILLLTLTFSSTAFAGSYEDDLKELFELAGVRNHYSNLNTVIISQMQSGFFLKANNKFKANEYNEDQKKQIGEILKNRFAEMVKDYNTFVNTFISYDKVADEVYVSLYKKYYSHDEVKQLLAFYKSDIGQKSINSAAEISSFASKNAIEKYDSRISDYLETQIDENIEIVEKEISTKVVKWIDSHILFCEVSS